MSQPSSPVLKARRQTRRLYSRMLYSVLGACLGVWLIRAVITVGNKSYVSSYATEDIQVAHHLLVPPRRGHTAHEAATPPLHPSALGTSIRNTTLTVILPVTASTVSNVDSHIISLLGTSPALAEVILLSPPRHHPRIRSSLRNILTKLDDVEVDLSIHNWLEGTDQGLAVIQTARRATTNWVLLVDENGLDDVDAMTRRVILLATPPPAPLPIGPRGLYFRPHGAPCLQGDTLPQNAEFLVPPFVMPTSLLPPSTDVGKYRNAWSSLGDYVSASGARSGGIVLGSPQSSLAWCHRYVPNMKDADFNLVSPHQSPHAIGDTPIASNKATSVAEASGTFLLVIHAEDTRHIAPIACGLVRRGYHTSVYALFDWDTIAAAERHTILLKQCALDLVHVHLSTLLRPAGAYKHQFLRLPEVPDVVISATAGELLAPILSFMAGSDVNLERPISDVRIPREDLPFCDWMSAIDLSGWMNWHVPSIQLAVITDHRPHSLRRLLSSMSNARYFGDSLNLRINIEQTADSETLQLTSEYEWEHGDIYLHHRVVHAGLMTAVIESWYPRDNDSYAIMLEDDVELSPLFYAWIKLSLLQYRYGKAENRFPNLFGISLYQQKNLELHPDGRQMFDARRTFTAAGIPHPNTPYLSQIPCSWGALYFPEQWREFHSYLVERLASSAFPLSKHVVPDVRSNRWTRSWKKYFIELVYLRGYVMLYPNYAGFASLSTNHLETGSHVKDMPPDAYIRKKKLFTVPLMPLPPAPVNDDALPPATGLLELPNARLPERHTLPVLDLLGTIVDLDTVSERGREQRTHLTGCGGLAARAFDVRELLCLH